MTAKEHYDICIPVLLAFPLDTNKTVIITEDDLNKLEVAFQQSKTPGNLSPTVVKIADWDYNQFGSGGIVSAQTMVIDVSQMLYIGRTGIVFGADAEMT